MNTFEDELLAELKTVVADQAQTRPVRGKRRLLIGLAACMTLVAGTAVALPLLGGEETTSSAYSVTVESGGQVTIKIVRFEDAEGLERELAKVGVSADVHYLSGRQTCRRSPAGVVAVVEPSPNERSFPVITKDGSGTMTVDPAKLRGTTLTIEVNSFVREAPARPGPADLMTGSINLGYLKTGTFGPCQTVNR